VTASDMRGVKLYIFDADGTLRRSTVPGQPIPNRDDEWELLPNVKEKVRQILSEELDAKIALASNQGGVELGYVSRRQACKMLNDLYKELVGSSAPKGLVQLCPDFEGQSACRKPNPGMLVAIMKHAGVPQESVIFIGDSEDDCLAAKNAGVRFMWAKDFFGWK
jgi:D-glycero-D-manno-heptose 1,7-bisphosphate phosphatase